MTRQYVLERRSRWFFVQEYGDYSYHENDAAALAYAQHKINQHREAEVIKVW